jgi:hypothetical protein
LNDTWLSSAGPVFEECQTSKASGSGGTRPAEVTGSNVHSFRKAAHSTMRIWTSIPTILRFF